jgi:DNA-binding MarR family transcriptional regulator
MLDLVVVGNIHQRKVAALCRSEGISHAALNALAVIEGNGEALAAGEVARRMHVTTGTMTSLLDTLEKNGLVERRFDSDDRRVVLVDVSPVAQEVLDRLLPAVQQLNKSVAGALGDEALATLVDMLADLRAGLDAAPDELPPARRRRPTRLDRKNR